MVAPVAMIRATFASVSSPATETTRSCVNSAPSVAGPPSSIL
jgi:hypothetical protein